MSSPKAVLKQIEEQAIEFVDFRFLDFRGKWHHITMHVSQLDEASFEEGFNFDGSSVDGWCEINTSDMFFVPDAATAFVDPFMAEPTLVLVCDILDAATGKAYNRCPRGIAGRAEEHLKELGIADEAFFGPELEYFIFDSVKYSTAAHKVSYELDNQDAAHWNSDTDKDALNHGHLTSVKGGYFQLAPTDRTQDMRTEILKVMRAIGIDAHLHHSEVATASQNEVGSVAKTLKAKADETIASKYIVKNVADMYGKTATFMPKPLGGDNGSGMHVHQSLWKEGKNLFAGEQYANLSETALHYIGGIIKHAKALNAFTNASTNSYKRLVPGFEAPTILTYAERNRSASIRIPASGSEKAKRIEVRFPDASANPYLALSALLMAGLDGVENQIDPGKAMENNLYDLSPLEEKELSHVCSSLEEALKALDADRDFLKRGGVFDDDMIDAYIELKKEEVERLNQTPHPVEVEMYYSV